MAMRASTFATLRGFDAAFPNNYNDVDLCLRARALGLEVICVATSEIIHEECRTRVGVTSLEERDRFYGRWAQVLSRPDPYYSPNLAPTEAIALNFDAEPRFRVLRDAGPGS